MKCGIEVHQRLLGNKLFCNCPSEPKNGPIMEVRRRLHPVLSELGEIDVAAQFEYLKGKEFVYQVYDNVCEVELDESPPTPLNGEALRTALEISLLLGGTPVDEAHVMRKIVLDGSAVTSFQRSALIATGGRIETSRGPIDIETICLEEESAGIVKEEDGVVTYRLDRHGIPLIEIATSPNIIDGEHALETAEKIGALLRLTGKVQRGIGTIRQDVNISTEKGARVEVKGAQELKLIPKLIENEVKRQERLVELYAEIRKRFGGKVAIKEKITDLTPVFKETKCSIIKKSISKGGVVLGMLLPLHKGLLGFELCKGRRYGTELSDYAKAAGVKGIIHCDEDMKRYEISDSEVRKLTKELRCSADDGFALITGEEEMTTRAMKALLRRALLLAVPEEVRKALPDGTTSYMRPLPGRARMYPETDVEPVKITKDMITEIGKKLPPKPEEKRKELLSMLNKELAEKMLLSRRLPLFEKIVGLGIDPVLAASTLENTLVSLKRDGVPTENLKDDSILSLFSEYKKETFVKAAIPDILAHLARNLSASPKDAIKSLGLERISGNELLSIVKREKDFGSIMAKYRLRVDPKEVQELLKRK